MADWEIHAVKYAEIAGRTRRDAFIQPDGDHDAPYPIDFFFWVLRRGERVILVDTGYDEVEGTARGRPIRRDPRAALAPLGIAPEAVTEVIVTHLHYDHAGGLHLFPNATVHLQAGEMAYATGPCMCHDALRAPFTGEHVCEAVRRLHAGRMIFADGAAEIADGVTVHRIGGHSRGLQCVRVRTAAGWMVLASDAAHFYENLTARKPFPIVVDMEDMLAGFDTLERLASRPDLVVPGHDPRVCDLFPEGAAPFMRRLDGGPF